MQNRRPPKRSAGKKAPGARSSFKSASGAKKPARKSYGKKEDGEKRSYGAYSKSGGTKGKSGKRSYFEEPAEPPKRRSHRNKTKKPETSPAKSFETALRIVSSEPVLESLTPAQRKTLKAKAHHLKPVVIVGKRLISESLKAEISEALGHHELIKIKFIEGKEEKKVYAGQIARQTECHLVAMIGNIAILYKQHPNARNRKIWL